MKTETYDSLIDGTIDAIIVLLISVVFYLVILSVALLGILTLSWLFPTIVYYYNGMWLHIAILPIAIMFSTFVYGLRKAKKMYDIKKFRDFWMAWATPVSSNGINDFHGSTKRSEINKWCNQNMSLYRELHLDKGGYSYIFFKKSDAVAFKLQWYDK